MKSSQIGRLAIAAGLSLFCAGVGAKAAETKIEGVLMGNYSLYTSQYKLNNTYAYDYNSFDIGRVYLTAGTKYSSSLASKIVLEANTLTAGNNVFLKFAFFQWKDAAERFTVEGGLPPTLWNSSEEANWKYRFVEKVQADLEGVLKSADKGVKVSYKLPAKLGTAEAMLSNGEGFSALETADYRNKVTKDGHLKVALAPIGGFDALTVSAHYIGVVGLPRTRERFTSGLFYKGKKFTLGASMFRSVDFSTITASGAATAKSGFSVYGDVPLSEKFSIFMRVDNVDNSTLASKSYDTKTLLIGGLACELAKDVKIALTERRSTQGQASARRRSQNIVSVDMTAKF